jgi:hypothetical protein
VDECHLLNGGDLLATHVQAARDRDRERDGRLGVRAGVTIAGVEGGAQCARAGQLAVHPTGSMTTRAGSHLISGWQ